MLVFLCSFSLLASEFDFHDQQKYQYYQYGMASFADCITAFKGEQTLTSGIMNVTDSNPKTVGIIATTNGSPIFAQTNTSSDPNTYAFYAMENLLDENGYDVSRLDMINDTLDTEKYDILVLPAPKTDLTTRKTTKKAAAKQDEEPKEEETKGE